MSPAVWTNNPSPGGCVPGGIISDGSRCWQRTENAMHNKYWSSGRVINELWLGAKKKKAGEAHEGWSARWCDGNPARRRWLFLPPRHTHTHTPAVTLEDEITAAPTLTQHTHRCKQRQLNAHIISRAHTRHNPMHAWDKDRCTNRRAASAALRLSFTMARWPFSETFHTDRNRSKWSAASRDEEGLCAQCC